MTNETIGGVLVVAEIENLGDWYMAVRGQLPAEKVRRVKVNDARIDRDVMTLAMPKRLIEQLGLQPVQVRATRTDKAPIRVRDYGAVRLTIQDRDCSIDVTEVPDEGPVLIGRIALALLDLVVDPVGLRLIGKPEHNGEPMIDLF